MSKINFDLDGVLYPWHSIIYEEMLLLGHIPFDMNYHTFWKYEWKKQDPVIKELVKENKYYIMSRPYPHAVELTNWLSNRKHEIWYYTQRPIKSYDATEIWLKSWHFPQVEHLVVSEDKMYEINKTHFNYFIDDRVEYLDKAKDVDGKILVAQPYNEDETKYHRIVLLQELYGIIK
jgi:hypothetical protein